ncbi:FUSC family protein [Francisellaceae bacterium]|nr:FUSC family protein [Francisellaceae bacterium]
MQQIINRYFYPQKAFAVAVSILPGLILGYIQANNFYFFACLLSISSIMPYQVSFNKRRYSIMLFLFLYLSSVVGACLLKQSPSIFWLVILIISAILGFLEANMDYLKKLDGWIFIGLLYGSYELYQYHSSISYVDYAIVLVVGSIQVFIYSLILKSVDLPRIFILEFKWNELIHYSKYILYFITALLVFHGIKANQPQWYFWSGLSVLSLEVTNAKQKIKDRILSGIIGLILGYITLQFIPTSLGLMVFSYMGIMLSLVAFKKYTHNFGVRCYFIVIVAGSQAFMMGTVRFTDIFIGGLVGLVMSYILGAFHKKLKT